jgi:hypothetical protein
VGPGIERKTCYEDVGDLRIVRDFTASRPTFGRDGTRYRDSRFPTVYYYPTVNKYSRDQFSSALGIIRVGVDALERK